MKTAPIVSKPQPVVRLLVTLFLAATGLFHSTNVSASGELPEWLTSEEKEWVNNLERPIILAPDPSFAPVEIRNTDGSLGGIAGDYIQLIEKMIGIKFQVKWYKSWADNVEDAEKGNVDVWSSVVKTPQRQEYMMFTEPYLQQKTVFIVRDSYELSPSFEKMGGARVALLAGWYHTDLINNKYPDLNYSTTPSISDGLKLLQDKEIDVLVVDILPATHEIKKQNLSGLRIAGDAPIQVQGCSIGSIKSEPILHSILTKALERITPAQRKEIYNSYVNIDSIKAKNVIPGALDTKVCFTVLALIIVLILFALIFSKKSQHQNKFSVFIGMILLSLAFSAVIVIYLSPELMPNALENSSDIKIKLSNEELEWLSSLDAPLRVAPDSDFAPIEWGNEKGEFEGMAIDYLKLIEKKLSTKFELLYFKSWAENRQAARNRELDFWTAVAPTPQRKEFMSFSSPHIHLKATLLVNSENNASVSLKTVKDQRIGVVKNYFTHHYLQNNYPSIKLVLFQNSREAIRSLAFNQVDAVFIDIATASHICRQEGVSTVKVSKVIDMGYNLCLASRKDYPILANILEKAVLSITPEEHSEIIKKWADTSTEATINRKLTSRFFIALISAVLLMGIWVYLLKRAVIQRTRTIEKTKMELQNANEYISTIIDSMPSILVSVSPDCLVTQWNDFAHKATGIPLEKALNQPLEKLIPHIKAEINQISKAISTGKQHYHPKCKYQKDGEVYYEDITIYPLISSGVEGAVIRIDNVTERTQMENIIVQTEKMQSVGGLASGMAHEINNPLGGIMQGYQNILNRIDPDKPKNQAAAEKHNLNLQDMYEYLRDRKVITFLEGGRTSCERAAQIVKNMLMFSRKSNSTLAPTSLSKLIERAIGLGTTDYDMKKKYDFKFVDIVKEYDSSLPLVNCCQSEIEQVLLNLFRNALQAIEGINIDGYNPQLHIRLIKEPKYARIEIEDNGPGIPDDVKKRIFEPFFTTKPVGTGTGLGLSVSYMIITQNHYGTFDVESEVGRGTNFIIRLPL